MQLLSVIVPCYNEEENIRDFYVELFKNQPFFDKRGLDVEVIYIDDGSRDHTLEEIKKLIRDDSRVHVVSFSKNFGKEAGIYAGLQKAKGDYVVMMMWICRIPLLFCRRCLQALTRATTVWLPAVSPERENPLSALSLLGCSIS